MRLNEEPDEEHHALHRGQIQAPALTARDANADPMLDLFDFTQAPAPPPTIAAPVVEPNELGYCKAQLSK